MLPPDSAHTNLFVSEADNCKFSKNRSLSDTSIKIGINTHLGVLFLKARWPIKNARCRPFCKMAAIACSINSSFTIKIVRLDQFLCSYHQMIYFGRVETNLAKIKIQDEKCPPLPGQKIVFSL